MRRQLTFCAAGSCFLFGGGKTEAEAEAATEAEAAAATTEATVAAKIKIKSRRRRCVIVAQPALAANGARTPLTALGQLSGAVQVKAIGAKQAHWLAWACLGRLPCASPSVRPSFLLRRSAHVGGRAAICRLPAKRDRAALRNLQGARKNRWPAGNMWHLC